MGRCSNPQFKSEELVEQLVLVKVSLMVVHSTVLHTVLEAASAIKLPFDRIILLDESFPSSRRFVAQTIPGLIAAVQQKTRVFRERKLTPGEGKMRIALLCWSSGTTGKPKVAENIISSYSYY